MVMAHILVPLLAPFIAAYPDVSLELIEKDDVQLEEAVISGELDCGVMTLWGSTRVAAYHLLTEEILLVDPLAARWRPSSWPPASHLDPRATYVAT
jgi:DNA-binding transcriptional LysR family regulator